MKPVDPQEPEQDARVELPSPPSDVGAGFGVPAEKLGRFLLQEPVPAEEGWSTFLAVDPVFEQEVVVHVAQERAFPDAAARTQFEEAAEVAKTLSHPSIVPVVGAGKSELGSYIVYQQSPGIYLDQWLAQQPGPLAGQSAAGLVQCLADAVQHAHQRGLLHRALSPAHILIDRSPASEDDDLSWFPTQVRINHFALGSAQRWNPELAQDRPDALPYLSPEERNRDVGTGSTADIYSLGAVLYRLSIGPLPPMLDLPWSDILVGCSMNKPLQTVCRKCLCKAPEDRYQTAFELADELIQCYPDPSTAGRPGKGLKKILRWPR